MSEVPTQVKAPPSPIPMGGTREKTVAQIGPAMGIALTSTGLEKATSQFKPVRPSKLPLAVAEPGTDPAAAAEVREKIDSLSLVNRAKKVLQDSLKEGGKMYIVDPLDAKTTANIENTAKDLAAAELGARKEPETPEDYQKRVDVLAEQKKPGIIQARKDFNTTNADFINGQLTDVNDNGLILKDKDGKPLAKPENANRRLRKLLEQVDPNLAIEHFRALRLVDPDGNQIKLADFMKGYVEQAQAEDPNKNEKDLKDEAREIFLDQAIITSPKEAVKPETKAGGEGAKAEFKPSEALLAEQKELANVALDYLAKFAENEISPLYKEARKHYVQLYLATKAVPIDGDTTRNPLLECSLLSFKKAFIDPSNLKGRVPFVHDPLLNLSRAVSRLENPVEAAVLKRLDDKRGTFDPNDTNARQKAAIAARGEIMDEIKAQAKARVNIELAKNPKTKLTQAQAETDIQYEKQQQVLELAKKKCADYFSTADLNLPPGLFEPGVLPEALASLYAASLIMGTGKPDDIKKAFEHLSHAQFMRNPDLKKLFLNKSTRDTAMESMLKTFLGDQKNRHDIAEEMQRLGILSFLGLKGKGLLATLGPTGIGMALMMALMGAEKELGYGLMASEGQPEQN